MADGPTTEDGKPIGGWVLRADPGGFDVAGTIAEFGQVFRFPLDLSPRAALMDAGQPCFLYSGDTSKVVGIWAVGEVVGPVTTVTTTDDDGNEVEQQHFAEVELLPLEKPIAHGKLKDHRVLATGELLTSPTQPNPGVLRPEEVRGLEEFDFAFVEPTDAQMDRLAEVLGQDEDGLMFQLVGADRSFGILDDGGDDEALAVVTVSDEGAMELGRFETFTAALEFIRDLSADLVLPEPVPMAADLPDGDPVAMLRVEDGVLSVFRTGIDVFDLYDPTEDGELEPLDRYASLPEALDGVLESIEEFDEDDDESGDAVTDGAAPDA